MEVFLFGATPRGLGKKSIAGIKNENRRRRDSQGKWWGGGSPSFNRSHTTHLFFLNI